MIVLELWQTEWCPASRRVRQRLTELGLDVVLHQVSVAPEERTALAALAGASSIPVLVAGREAIVGEEAILAYLDARFAEPEAADSHRVKAARARARDLEEACRELTAPTP